MTTLQEYLNWRYPTKEEREKVKRIDNSDIKTKREKQGITELLDGGELDLSEFVNVETVGINRLFENCLETPLTKITLGDMPNLVFLDFSYNQLTSVGFLKQLSHPEKLVELKVPGNKLTGNLEIFRPFVNLKTLQIGNMGGLKGNSFCGSLEPIKNLSKLTHLCVEGTDIDEGLEYIPSNLAERTKGNPGYMNFVFDCTAGKGKVKKIQDQLRPFNYDIEAWQLAHPEKMLIARPELFTTNSENYNYSRELLKKFLKYEERMLKGEKVIYDMEEGDNKIEITLEMFENEEFNKKYNEYRKRLEEKVEISSKEKWLTALKNKIQDNKETLNYLIQNEPNKEAKIIRLETQIKILEEIMEQEREIHQDSMKAMDNFYQQNPPQENIRLKNILQEFEKKYLQLNREKQTTEKENKELKQNIEVISKIAEQENQPKETKEQGTQTDLTGQGYEQQQKENQELREQISRLTVKKGK